MAVLVAGFVVWALVGEAASLSSAQRGSVDQLVRYLFDSMEVFDSCSSGAGHQFLSIYRRLGTFWQLTLRPDRPPLLFKDAPVAGAPGHLWVLGEEGAGLYILRPFRGRGFY